MKKQPRFKNPGIFNFREIIRGLSDIENNPIRQNKTEKGHNKKLDPRKLQTLDPTRGKFPK